ncbi:Aste57867_12 [Aphanomyces stellatus]|uniref:Aste57867_12 protein n=1 Tax=Aphanomyces stellatus TaxID=120398 RepID=A0A485K6G4_9STRA|nr:hypothetical protein As57867_000012 [Aphanomyces stellatus]VFT77238.1 Aste57867_12 [Aphanomyces stellatus]
MASFSRKAHLKAPQRLAIYTRVQETQTNNKPAKDVVVALATQYNVTSATVVNIWKRGAPVRESTARPTQLPPAPRENHVRQRDVPPPPRRNNCIPRRVMQPTPPREANPIPPAEGTLREKSAPQKELPPPHEDPAPSTDVPVPLPNQTFAASVTETTTTAPSNAKANLSDAQRAAVYHRLLLSVRDNGKPPRGFMTTLSVEFNVHRATIKRIWLRGQETAATQVCADVSARLKGNSGRKTKYPPDEINRRVAAAPDDVKQSYRLLAAHTKIPRTILWMHMQKHGKKSRHAPRRGTLPFRDNTARPMPMALPPPRDTATPRREVPQSSDDAPPRGEVPPPSDEPTPPTTLSHPSPPRERSIPEQAPPHPLESHIIAPPNSTTTTSDSKANLSDAQRAAVYHRLLLSVRDNGKPPRGFMTTLSTEFNVHRATIKRIWLRGQETAATQVCADVSARLKGNSGRKTKYPAEEIDRRVAAAPDSVNTSYRLLAEHTKIPRTILWVHMQKHGKKSRPVPCSSQL